MDSNSCGDAKKADGEIFREIILQDVLCQGTDGDGNLVIAYALSWRSSAGACNNPNDPEQFFDTQSSKCFNGVSNFDNVGAIPPQPDLPIFD